MRIYSSRRHILNGLPHIFLSVCLVLSLLLSPAFFNTGNRALAATSAEKEAELDQALIRLDALQTEINQITVDYDAAVIAHSEAEAKMLDAQAREQAARERVADLQEQLGARADQMYRDGTTSYLDVLFGAETFTDFITAMDLINRVNEQNAQLVKETKEAREAAQAARIEYTEQEKITREKQTQIQTLKSDKETAAAAMQEEITNLEAEMLELRLQEELAAEAAKKMAANLGVDSLGGVSQEQLGRIFAIGPVYPFYSSQPISSGFGYRDFDSSFHTGVDFAAPGGTPILAVASGTVYQAGSGGAMGNYVMIAHGDRVFSTYMHASSLNCSTGQAVVAGQEIAYVGTTGNSTGNHLHLEITVDGPSFGGGTWVNPMLFYT